MVENEITQRAKFMYNFLEVETLTLTDKVQDVQKRLVLGAKLSVSYRNRVAPSEVSQTPTRDQFFLLSRESCRLQSSNNVFQSQLGSEAVR